MKRTNSFSALVVFSVVLCLIPACSSSKSSDGATVSPKTSVSPETANAQTTNNTEAPKTDKPKTEKADFTMTAEELDKEFTRKGVNEKELKKYASKNISGDRSECRLISLEKKGTTQPWVTLFAPGIGHGVSCYFDEDNLDQIKRLKMDKMVKVQGFQDDFIVPEVSPRLEHCVVIKAD